MSTPARPRDRAAPQFDQDAAIRAAITRRIEELTAEMRNVATAAAEQASLPYRAAIGELERLLVSDAGDQPRPAPATNGAALVER
jgi:hypothetical protein